MLCFFLDNLDAKERGQERWDLPILKGMVSLEKVSFEQRFEGSEGVGYVGI